MIGESDRVTNKTLYEVVSYRGEIFGPFKTTSEAAMFAAVRWPGQEQDEDRTGKGWDVQIAGIRDPRQTTD